MTDLTYRVATSTQRSPIRYGHLTAWAYSPQALADATAMDVRQIRPEADGALTVHVWPTRDGEHYWQPIPDDAEHFDYPATPTA